MKIINAILPIVTVMVLACNTPDEKNSNMEPEEKFEYTATQQDAVFYIATGYVGSGSGTMPVIDHATGNPKEYNGLAIFFDERFSGEVDAKLPLCVEGMPEIKISATILLREREGIAATEIPKTIKYYEAEVIKLHDIVVQADSCNLEDLLKG